MPGQIIERGKRTWLVRVYEGIDQATGKRKYSNKTIHGTKKQAQNYLNNALARHDGVPYDVEKILASELFDALLLDYKTNGKSYSWVSDVVRVHLGPFFGWRRAAHIGTDQINAYIAKRREPARRLFPSQKVRNIPPAANATINRELALLRRAFNLGKRSTPPKVVRVPNIAMLAENNVRKGFFEYDAFVAVRKELPEEIRPVVTFAFFTGCRKGEILGLQWSQIDLTQRLVRLEPGTTKNDEGRTIFMAPELYEVLTLTRQVRDELFPDCPWVFARAGERIRDFKASWKVACKAAGLVNAKGEPEKLFHDLRRTGVRNLIRAGVPERVAMMISGHKTRAVFDRYNIVSESDLKDAARRLGDYLAQKSAPPADPHTIRTQPASGPVQ